MAEVSGGESGVRFVGLMRGRLCESSRFLGRRRTLGKRISLVLGNLGDRRRGIAFGRRTKKSKRRTEGGQANGPGITREKASVYLSILAKHGYLPQYYYHPTQPTTSAVG